MGKTVAFLAETPGSAMLDEQRAAMDPADYIVEAGSQGFGRLRELLVHGGLRLAAGDRVKVFDLACVALETATLIRAIGKLLHAGIAFEIVAARVVIDPELGDMAHALLRALDGHRQHRHGVKTHPPDAASRGRKRLLSADQLPSILAKLAEPGATATRVAKDLGIARTTLFNFLDRHDLDRRGAGIKKGGQGGVERSRDQRHVTEAQAGELSVKDPDDATRR